MKFEHLIEINDILNPLAEVITREQLWRGLVLRAESPKLFVSYLDDALIEDRTEASMTRTLKYGELSVTDTVRFVHLEHVHYDIAAQGEIRQSSLRMTIEEPQPDSLFVRFQYDDGATEEQDKETKCTTTIAVPPIRPPTSTRYGRYANSPKRSPERLAELSAARNLADLR
jgi:hypothetical protein